MSLFWSVLSQVSLSVKLDAACLIGNLFSRKSLSLLSLESIRTLEDLAAEEGWNDLDQAIAVVDLGVVACVGDRGEFGFL